MEKRVVKLIIIINFRLVFSRARPGGSISKIVNFVIFLNSFQNTKDIIEYQAIDSLHV